MRKLLTLGGLVFALATTACGEGTGPGGGDGDGDGNGSPGNTSFSADVSGGAELSASGVAYFGDDENTTGTGFGLGLGTLDEDAPLSIAFQREQPGRLAAGSYPVFDTTGDGESTPASLMAAATLHDDGQKACVGTGGTLVITESAADELSGSFTATFTCYDFTDQLGEPVYDVTISGEFDADRAVVPL